MKKPEVRKLAKKFGLITAEKKDSQGLCFVGKVDMKEFLSHYIRQKRGKVLNERGEVVGEHSGVFFYTLGERIAVNLSNSSEGEIERGCESAPFFIISKDIKKNTLTVSPKSSEGNVGGMVNAVSMTDCNWLCEPVEEKTYQARIRYRQPLQRCTIEQGRPLRGAKGALAVRFEQPQTVAPGQSLVLYDGDVLVGGGIIK